MRVKLEKTRENEVLWTRSWWILLTQNRTDARGVVMGDVCTRSALSLASYDYMRGSGRSVGYGLTIPSGGNDAA